MARKRARGEEHVDESWLLPYSDLLTLLLALFIVMFAMSSIDKEKFERMSQQLNAIFSGGSGLMETGGKLPIVIEPSATETEDSMMNEIKENLEEQIRNDGYSGKVNVDLNRDGLEISIQDVVLFNSGEAEVLESVYPFLLQIAKMVGDLDNSIKVVGHTDNVPIHNSQFRSNWDLSVIRAINVMQFLVDQGGLKPERFSIQGFGQYAPKYDNSTEDGRAKNRRVEIFLGRMYPVDE